MPESLFGLGGGRTGDDRLSGGVEFLLLWGARALALGLLGGIALVVGGPMDAVASSISRPWR
jgi:hypothetical protein